MCLKCTKIRLAAGELKHSPDPLAAIKGVLLLRGGRGVKVRKEVGEEREKEKEREGKRG